MKKQAVRIVSQTPSSLHLYLDLKYEMPEVFTVLLYKGTSSKYANRLSVSNLNGDFMKYVPTDGERKKKKKRKGEFNSVLFTAIETTLT